MPLKLLAVQSLLTHKIDYWGDGTLAPAVCKILNVAQAEYKICEMCWVARAQYVPGQWANLPMGVCTVRRGVKLCLLGW